MHHDTQRICSHPVSKAFLTTAAQPKQGAAYMTLLTLNQYPLSRGHVHIASPKGTTPPVIDPHMFENTVDLDLFALCVRNGLAPCRTTECPSVGP